MKAINTRFVFLGFFFFFFLFLNSLDDSFLLFLNFLFVIFCLFFFLRDLFNDFIKGDIEDLYYKYIYYYEINIESLSRLKNIYMSQCKNSKVLFLKLYLGVFTFYNLNFINLLLNSYFLNLNKIEDFLFSFFENEILIKKSTSLVFLFENLDSLELGLSDDNLKLSGIENNNIER